MKKGHSSHNPATDKYKLYKTDAGKAASQTREVGAPAADYTHRKDVASGGKYFTTSTRQP